MLTTDHIKAAKAELSRRDFHYFRQHTTPKFIDGWFQRDVARHLEEFRDDLLAGKRPRLLIQAPPQHGKSWIVGDFVAWLSGHHPEIRTIYTSFSERLGVRANLRLQRLFDGGIYHTVFDTSISPPGAIGSAKARNRELLEFTNGDGYFRNTTVRGSITGEGLDLGIIDDPIKGREEANSATVRDRTWDWLTDDFMSRFSDSAGLLGIMTRWHVDDPFGRLIKSDPNIKVLRYPAIGIADSEFRKAGEALFPEHKSLDFLLRQKADMHPGNFEALYQQNPVVQGGDIFRDDWWQYHRHNVDYEYRLIFADTAQKTGQKNDYSVFQEWGYKNGFAYLIDQIRGKWEAPELLSHARNFWNRKQEGRGKLRQMRVEDKVSGTGLIQTLKREAIPVKGIQRDKDKILRAHDAAPDIEAGRVFLPEGASWLKEYIGEFSAFPNGTHDDQVDPTMDAIAELSAGTQRVEPIRIRV